MKRSLRMSIRLLFVFFAAAMATAVMAQDVYPSRPVHVIVAFPPGGVTDVVARLMASEMQKEFGQPFVVENRPGAAGMIGAEYVAKAKPDGYTLFFIPNTHLVLPALHNEMPYDSLNDFTAITLLATGPSLFIVRSDAPWRNLKEFIADAKARPNGIQWASSGIGVSTHLGGELFQYLADIKLFHVPYNGSSQPVQAVIAGQVSAAISALNASLPHIKSGRVRALAVATEKRSSFLPDVPTFEELGVTGMRNETWIGVLAPAKLPRSIAVRLNQFFMKTIARPDMKERLAAIGAEPVGVELEKFAALMRAEAELNRQIVTRANIKLE
jgi:tripartite-type tricarboxylate transporter receptor subunit TctC